MISKFEHEHEQKPCDIGSRYHEIKQHKVLMGKFCKLSVHSFMQYQVYCQEVNIVQRNIKFTTIEMVMIKFKKQTMPCIAYLYVGNKDHFEGKIAAMR